MPSLLAAAGSPNSAAAPLCYARAARPRPRPPPRPLAAPSPLPSGTGAARLPGLGAAMALYAVMPGPPPCAAECATGARAGALNAAGGRAGAAAEAAGFRAQAFNDYAAFLTTLLTRRPPPSFDDLSAYPSLAELVFPRNTPRPTQGLILATLSKPWASADERDRVIETVRAELADLNDNPQRPADRAVLSGISVLGYDTQRAIAGSLGQLLALSAGAVLLRLVVFFRHPLSVVLALSPAAGGLTLMLAVIWISGGSFNLINLMAVPLLVGIGVDEGIFLTALYRNARRAQDTALRLREDLAASAHAIGMTSLTTALAFGSLYFTHVPAIKSLGLMVAAGVAGAFFVSVCGLVPGLVLLFEKQSAKRKAKSEN